MGMYTGIRFKAKLNEHGKGIVQKLLDTGSWEGLHEFSKIGRSPFIPFGVLSCMPDSWDKSREDADRTPLSERRVWTVCCSLKNYENEIEYFLEKVLPGLIAETTIVEYLYEEWKNSKFIEVSPGHGSLP